MQYNYIQISICAKLMLHLFVIRCINFIPRNSARAGFEVKRWRQSHVNTWEQHPRTWLVWACVLSHPLWRGYQDRERATGYDCATKDLWLLKPSSEVEEAHQTVWKPPWGRANRNSRVHRTFVRLQQNVTEDYTTTKLRFIGECFLLIIILQILSLIKFGSIKLSFDWKFS